MFGSSLGFGVTVLWFFLTKNFGLNLIRTISEKSLPATNLLVLLLIFLLLPLAQILLGNLFYSYSKSHTQEAKLASWKLEYEKECGPISEPYFQNLHYLIIVHNVFYLLGIILGLFTDSLLLGGTPIVYNQDPSPNHYVYGVVRLIVYCSLFFIVEYSWEYFGGLTENVWITKFWLCLMMFVFCSFIKYLFKIARIVGHVTVEEAKRFSHLNDLERQI